MKVKNYLALWVLLLALSVAPTAADFTEDCTGGCTEDVHLQRQSGRYAHGFLNYTEKPISILSQDGRTVTFEIKHEWGNITLDHFFVEYNSPGWGHACLGFDNFTDDGQCVPITAKCIRANSVASVTLTTIDYSAAMNPEWSLDALTSRPDIPKTCCGYEGDGISRDLIDNDHVAQYVFKLHCLPVDCTLPASSSASPSAVLSLLDSLLEKFAVLAGSAITFAATAVTGGDVGYTSAVTGGSTLTNGAQEIATLDFVALTANITEIWAAGMATKVNATNIPSPGIGDAAFPGDSIITAGTWHASTISIAAFKTVTLDAQGDPDAVFLFQTDTTMLLGADCKIILVNGAKAENVVWTVGAALTIGADVHFQGSILAGAAVTIGATAAVEGSVIALAAIGIGATSVIDGSIISGAAITLGATSQVQGSVVAVTAITFGAESSVVGGTFVKR
jgi:hypothetical protein